MWALRVVGACLKLILKDQPVVEEKKEVLEPENACAIEKVDGEA